VALVILFYEGSTHTLDPARIIAGIATEYVRGMPLPARLDCELPTDHQPIWAKFLEALGRGKLSVRDGLDFVILKWKEIFA
jgi:hypothetical protein